MGIWGYRFRKHKISKFLNQQSSYLYPYIITCLKKLFLLLTIVALGSAATGQNAFSVATDLSVLRNMNTDQEFFAIGQNFQLNIHLTPKGSFYGSVSYYSAGKFDNTLTALAKDSVTMPQSINYTADSRVRYRNMSLGLKYYFKGEYSSQETWNIYGTAGFGIIFGKAENSHNPVVDTALYEKPYVSIEGAGQFKRLTLDLALGTETPIGSGIYLYTEVKTWLRASDYPSPYLYNQKAPNVVILCGGLRLLFD